MPPKTPPKPKYTIGRKGDELLEEGEITPRGKNWWDGTKRVPITPTEAMEYRDEKRKEFYAAKSPPPKVIEVIREVSRPPPPPLPKAKAPLSDRSKARIERTRQIFDSEASLLNDVRRAFYALPEEERPYLEKEFFEAVEQARVRYADDVAQRDLDREAERTRKPLTKAELEWAMSDDIETKEDVKELKSSIKSRPNNEVSSAKIMPSSNPIVRQSTPSDYGDLFPPPTPMKSPYGERIFEPVSPPIEEYERVFGKRLGTPPLVKPLTPKVEQAIQKMSSAPLSDFDFDTIQLTTAREDLDTAVDFPSGNFIIQKVESGFKEVVQKYMREICYTVNRNTDLLKAYWDALDKAKSRVQADHLRQLREQSAKNRAMDTPDGYERNIFGDFDKLDTPSRPPTPESPKMTQAEIEAMFAGYSDEDEDEEEAQVEEEEEEEDSDDDYFDKWAAKGNGLGRKLKLLELFKGTGSVGKAARRKGMEVKSLDFLEKYKPDILADMLTWDYKKWSQENSNYIPDLIWASPPCNTFSPLAYRWKERNTKTATPYSARAKQGTQILYRTLEVIRHFQRLNPKLLFIIENPRGMMRMDAKMKKFPMETTTYCAYGDFKRKPTDFWNNLPNGLTLKPVGACPNPEKVIGNLINLKTQDERYSIPQRLMTKLLTEMAIQYGEKPKNVIGGMLMNAKRPTADYWNFNEDNNSIEDTDKEEQSDFPLDILGGGKKKVADMTEAEREAQNAYSREYKRLKRDLAKTTLIPKQNKTAVLNELMAKYPAYAENLAKKRNKAPCGEGCFSEAEVQELLKEMAEWVKTEVIEPSKAEVLKEAKAELKALKEKNKKKRVYASEVPVKTKKQVERYNKLYAEERAEHQASLKENYPTASGRGLKKGSAEAKSWGEKMRAMRGKGKSPKVIEKKTCCKMCSGSGCYCCR